MNSSQYPIVFRSLAAGFCGIALVACGGGSATSDGQLAASSDNQTLGSIYAGRGTITKPDTKTPSAQPAAQVGRTITDVRIEAVAPATAQSNVPFTFGQVFAIGDVPAGSSLIGRLDDGSTIALQVDKKATHSDGSVRHAIVSGVLPTLNTSSRTLNLAIGNASAGNTVTPSAALASGLTASFNATLGGVRYTASADELLKTGKFTTWLAGPVANEWHVSAPLKTSAGVEHPHLTARFAIRWYDSSKKARIDMTIENNWAYENAPQNFVYDAQAMVGGKTVYSKNSMTHFHHARWRNVAWFGNEPSIHIKHNTGYLIDTKALPNYDRSLVIPEAALASLKSKWTGDKTQPMGVGLANPYMPSTGGRDDIGLLPGWAATYLLSMDARAKTVTLGTADLAGSWSSHYRDKLTDRPVTVNDFPYMTILGSPGDTLNPVTKKREAFPVCATTTGCTTPNSHDSAHQPAFAYLPYLVTGDYYYLEELQFWTMWNVFSNNPIWRQTSKGLLNSAQVRGQAWGMRNLAEAAYITPDNDVLKSQFITLMDNNLAWYNAEYTDNKSANVFGALTMSNAMVYNNKTGLAPWQDDFFTSAIGHATELGFPEAGRLLTWKAKFPVQRMTDPDLCWIDGALYTLVIRNSQNEPFFTSLKPAADLSESATFRSLACGSVAMANFLKLKVGEMTGYSSTTMGYPSNMQPALAYASTVMGSNGQAAWSRFMSRTVKPDYAQGPQFAVVPRTK